MNDAVPYLVLNLCDIYTGSQKGPLHSTVEGAVTYNWLSSIGRNSVANCPLMISVIELRSVKKKKGGKCLNCFTQTMTQHTVCFKYKM